MTFFDLCCMYGVHVCHGVCVSMCVGQRTARRSQFSPSTLCVLGIELGLSVLAARALIHLTSSKIPFLFSSKYIFCIVFLGVCMNVLLTCVYVGHIHAGCTGRLAEGVTGGCELPCVC